MVSQGIPLRRLAAGALSALLLLAAAAPVPGRVEGPAAKPPEDPRKLLSPGYKILATTHYRVWNKDAETAAKVGAYLESLHAAFFAYVRPYARAAAPAAPLDAVLVADEAEYDTIARRVARVARGASGGFFDSRSGVLLLRRYGPFAPAHEGTHQLMHLSGVLATRADLWADEGFADYIAGGYGKAGFSIGRAHRLRLENFRAARTRGLLLPVEKVVALGTEENFMNQGFTPEQVEVAYDQAWAIVHFLIEGEGGKNRARFFAYLRDANAENRVEPQRVEVPRPGPVHGKNPSDAKRKAEIAQRQYEERVRKEVQKAREQMQAQIEALDGKRVERFREYFGEDLAEFQRRVEAHALAIPEDRLIPMGELAEFFGIPAAPVRKPAPAPARP